MSLCPLSKAKKSVELPLYDLYSELKCMVGLYPKLIESAGTFFRREFLGYDIY